jgi:hypothetical protein
MKRILSVTACLLLLTTGFASAEVSAPGQAAEPLVTVVTAVGVQASVTFEGDYGPSRLEGSILLLPDEPIRAREGKQTKEIPLRQLQELQRTPLGVGPDAVSTYQLSLFSGESYILQPDKTEPPAGPQPAAVTRMMQVASVPKGVVELKTELFGVVRIPFPKLLQLTVQPIRGTLREAPDVPLPLQVLEGMTLNVPFQRITNFRRDPMGGTATVSFGIAEGVTGRVKSMPTGAILVRMPDGTERRIPLGEIVQYNLEGPISVAVNLAPTGPAPESGGQTR